MALERREVGDNRDPNAFMLLCRFDTKDLVEEEMEKGVPEARLVDIIFIADEPRIFREGYRCSYS